MIKTSHKTFYGVLFLTQLTLSGCDTIGSIANNAPPARQPVLISTDGLYSWPGDPALYANPANYNATVRVETQSINRVSLELNGAAFALFDGANPDNDARTVYTAQNLLSPNGADYSLNEYKLFFPTRLSKRLGGGAENKVDVIEVSNNPQYSATPATLSIPVKHWNKQCLIDAKIDSPIHVGDVKSLTIKGTGCKKIQLDLNDAAFKTIDVTGATNEVDTTLNVTVSNSNLKVSPLNGQRYLEFKITGTSPVEKTLVSYANAWELLATPCPVTSDNPSGAKPMHTFCVACPSPQFAWFVSDGWLPACTRQEATDLVQSNNGNCSVSQTLASTFNVCTQCPGRQQITDRVDACTSSQALGIARAAYDSQCAVNICP